MQSQKQQNDLCFQGKPFNIMVIQVYALTSNAEEAEVEWFCEDLQGLLNIQKRCPSHYRGLECKSRNVLGVTGIFGLGVQNEAGQRITVLPREHTDRNKHPLPTTQEKTLHMDITIWSTPKSD